MVKVSNDKIDFVIAWVDGSDEKWQEEKNKYKNDINDDKRINAYRDWDLLRYWFRGVEKFAGWVNKVYFVTWGHIPEWLNTDYEKIVIVNHKDFIPEQYLPTFSSRPIELNLHRIEGLSETFSYFNDDMYIISKMDKTDFFINGVPRDRAVLTINIPKEGFQIQKINNNNISIINEEFDFKSVLKKEPFKWFNFKYGVDNLRTLWLLPCPRFPGIKHDHANGNYLKTTYNTVWNKFYNKLDRTSYNRFRNMDVDVNQWLIKDWQIASGNFIPQEKNTYFCDLKFKDKFGSHLNHIKNQKSKIVCINDAENMGVEEFNEKKQKLIEAFESILPEKSSFEK